MNLCRVESLMNMLYQVVLEESYVVPILKQIKDGC